ncbi:MULTISPECIES: ABC transporter permease [Olivibacter]|uniref:ABC transporter permease n=1 Tax=Olivibacter jilunii TaxID=985016 RepID=A0ABW6B0N7_9SPHI|nr:ABC transporter permease [Olivibacter sp. UJ_SKK_5.1]
MFKNYLKTVFRNLFNNKSYAVINIVWLSVSLSAVILISLWVWDEWSFDRIHSKRERLYRVSTTFDIQSNNVFPQTPPPLAMYAKSSIPGIEDACRFSNSDAVILLPNQQEKFSEQGQYTDSTFFQLFDFPLLQGDRRNPFQNDNSIIISKSLAKKYFGKVDAMGQHILVGIDPLLKESKQPFLVTGIMEDLPSNSSIQADFFIPFNLLKKRFKDNDTDWGHFSFRTYFLLQKNTNPQLVEEQLVKLQQQQRSDELFKKLVYFLQPIEKIHLYNGDGTDNGAQQVRIFSLIAFVILFIACINYLNLVTARSTKRSKEVSVRKVIGANRLHLFLQFIVESCVVFVISILLATLFIYLSTPYYNELSGKELSFNLSDPRIWLIFSGALLITVLLAGIYPALALSAFKPVQGLKGVIGNIGKETWLRRTLVIIQFTSTVILIITTFIISRQMIYIQQKDMGYQQENVFVFPQINFLHHFESIRTELERNPSIKGITSASSIINDIGSSTGDIDWPGKSTKEAQFMVNNMVVDHKFLHVMGMQLLAGRSFSGRLVDSSYIILNQTAVREMGLKDPVGKTISFRNSPRTIIGVVKDFHFQNLRERIQPCILFYDTNWALGGMYVKASAGKTAEALASVERLWKQYNPEYEFQYEFLDARFDELYKSDIRAGKLLNIFACIAILLSCLGLFGLVTITAESKIKEIGIRKTLGATILDIMLLVSKNLIALVSLSIVIAFPLAYWLMKRWLNNYAYHTDISLWVFVGTGLLVAIIALLTIYNKALKAARNNPVNAIRTE